MRRAFVLLLLLTASWASAADAHRGQWIGVADRLISTPPQDYPFNWGEGVQMIGLLKVHQRTSDRKYADYVGKWFSFVSQEAIVEVLRDGDKSLHTKPGYCGHWSPGTAALYLYQTTGDPDHLSIAGLIADFIRNKAERHPEEGGLAHWMGNHQYWVDTLYMACPLLAGLARQHRDPVELRDAVNQLEVFARHLQNSDTGLFYHMWDWDKDEHTAEPWGRGNGWVIMSLADTLEVLDSGQEGHAALAQMSRKLAAGLDRTQATDGMWRTVLDDSQSYPEASATAMFVYGLLKLVRLGVLPETYVPVARRGWRAVNQRYVKDGVVLGVSAGTGPQGAEYYKKRPLGSYTWGTGAYLMAGSEIDRLK